MGKPWSSHEILAVFPGQVKGCGSLLLCLQIIVDIIVFLPDVVAYAEAEQVATAMVVDVLP